jgi:predicted metallo-beta-lactamase superfamily hydrolase
MVPGTIDLIRSRRLIHWTGTNSVEDCSTLEGVRRQLIVDHQHLVRTTGWYEKLDYFQNRTIEVF